MKKWFVEYLVPANRRFGIKIVTISDDSKTFILKLPYKRKNLNVGRTVHGAAIMCLAETVHGVAVLWNFDPKNHRMVTSTTYLQFIKPGRSDLFVKFGLSEETVERLEQVLSVKGNTDVEYECQVTDGDGNLVAILKNKYHLARLGYNKDMRIEVGQSSESIQASYKIRNEVFFEEQGIPMELDLDGCDHKSHHLLAFVNGQVVGISRLTPIENKKAILSRVAVKKEYRGFGIASKIVKASLIQAEKLKVRNIEITPHEYLREFYETFGFKYIEKAGAVTFHQLIKMEMPLC